MMVEVLRKVSIVKERGHWPEAGDKTDMACLHRLLRWRDCQEPCSEAPEHKADTRDENLQAQLGLRDGSQGLSSQGVKEKGTSDSEVRDDSGRPAVHWSARITNFGYVALCRREMRIAAKECARATSCSRP